VENAEENYKQRIEDANHESKKILQESLKRKDEIIAEAGSLASQRKDEIIDEAHHKAYRLVEEAKKRNESLQTELENNFAK
jgi:vacuolar-type H+-ATPase subunit H